MPADRSRSPAENAATVREALDFSKGVTGKAQIEEALAALAALLAQAEAGADGAWVTVDHYEELLADRDAAVRAAAEHRIEADHAHDDYEDAEAVIRQIAEKRPNQPFDPWAVELCQAFLDRPVPARAALTREGATSSEGRGNREHLSSARAAAPPDPEDES